jgi:cyanophycinase-like exopeptidase
MVGTLLLAGSGEFTPAMVAVDEILLRHTPGTPPRVAIVPTASGLEGPVPLDWIARGVSHFTALGCAAFGVPILNRTDADNPQHAAALAGADLIYLSGGNPRHLVASLDGTVAWAAIRAAWAGGATLAGSSAGAMALAELTVAPRTMPPSWLPAFGLLPGIGILPHFDRFGSARSGPLSAVAPPHLAILGIDEDTVVLIEANGAATVLGVRTVTLLRGGAATVFAAGEALPEGVVRPVAP